MSELFCERSVCWHTSNDIAMDDSMNNAICIGIKCIRVMKLYTNGIISLTMVIILKWSLQLLLMNIDDLTDNDTIIIILSLMECIYLVCYVYRVHTTHIYRMLSLMRGAPRMVHRKHDRNISGVAMLIRLSQFAARRHVAPATYFTNG